MVSLASLFQKLFGSRKRCSTAIADSSPPPYDGPTANASSAPEKQSPFLNPALTFTAEEIEEQLGKKDAIFAAAVVELMLPRLKLGVWQEPVGWGHYSFTLDKVRHPLFWE